MPLTILCLFINVDGLAYTRTFLVLMREAAFISIDRSNLRDPSLFSLFSDGGCGPGAPCGSYSDFSHRSRREAINI